MSKSHVLTARLWGLLQGSIMNIHCSDSRRPYHVLVTLLWDDITFKGQDAYCAIASLNVRYDFESLAKRSIMTELLLVVQLEEGQRTVASALFLRPTLPFKLLLDTPGLQVLRHRVVTLTYI